MTLKWEDETTRYYIKLNPKKKAKLYIVDNRSTKIYKPSTQYLKALQDLLKVNNRTQTEDRKIYSFLNDTTVSNIQVSGLLSKYKFTESDKFTKLYNAPTQFIKHWKSKMIFEINDVKKALNGSVLEAN